MKWVVALLHLTAAIQVGPEGAIREKNATQALEAFGSAKCPCVGFADVKGVTMALVGESYVAYPGDLGSSCQPWDQNRNPECQKGEGRKSWCKQPWCYVDARKCDLEVVPTLSKYLPSARFQNMPLFYSYDTCGVETPKIDQDPVDGCKCIGIDHRAGSFAVSLDDGLVQYPAELGGSCQAWDAHLHPLCAAGRPPEFCQQKWCYVDPCKCTVKSPPKEALYFNATMRGKSIYYSYEACGFKDAFTPSFSKNACVNAKEEKECGLLPKCAWSGSTCLGKELVVPELCSLEKEAYNGTKVEDLRSFCGSAVLSSFLLTVLSIFNL